MNKSFIQTLVLLITIVTTCLGFNLVFLSSDDGTFLESIFGIQRHFFMTVSMACFLSLFVYVFYSINEASEVKRKLSDLKNKMDNLESKMDEIRRDLRRNEESGRTGRKRN